MADGVSTLHRAIAGERRALARAITLIELRRPEIGAALHQVPVRRRRGPGQPHVLGLTGPPGAGKSTLVDGLVAQARAQGERVAVIAVDPSSPFSGGAILGDRIRMERHTGDDGVFVRSLSSRGHLGGLSSATAEVVDLFDAAGFDRVLVETVGVGQSELGVMEVADTVLVVLTPESGDSVQAMKAGLLEIADLFVINKADRPGADRLARELMLAVELSAQVEPAWSAPVRQVVASQQVGIELLWDDVARHRSWCSTAGRPAWQRRRGDAAVRLTLDLAAEEARSRALAGLEAHNLLQDLRAGTLSPHEALQKLRGSDP
jgi:LAO/AO transport system kinase